MKLFTFMYLLMFSFKLTALTWHSEKPNHFSIQVDIPNSHLSAGDILNVDVKVTYPNTYAFNVEKFKSNLLSHNVFKATPFTLIDLKKNSEEKDDIVTESLQFHLKSQFEGLFYLSFYSTDFIPRDSTEKPVIIISELFEIRVDPLNIDSTIPILTSRNLLPLSDSPPITIDENNYKTLLANPKMQIIEAQRNIKLAEKNSIPWPEMVLTALAVLFLIMVYISPPRKPQVKSPKQIILKAREKALKTIESIKLSKTEPAQFYVELTDAVRNYIEEQYQIEIATHTTQEFLKEAAHYSTFSEQMKKELKQFLIHADKVKFAKYYPSSKECEQAAQAAKKVISASLGFIQQE